MKNFRIWPAAILGIFATVVTAIIFTLYLTLEEPLEYDAYFDGDYDYVKKNYHRLEQDSRQFDRCCELIPPETLNDGKNILRIEIKQKINDAPVEVAEISAWFTRPATNKYDIQLGTLRREGAQYVSAPFEIETKGIWSLELNLKLNDRRLHRSIKYDYMDPLKP